MLVQLSSEQEFRAFHRLLHGKRLTFSGADTMLQVASSYIDWDSPEPPATPGTAAS